MHVLADRRQAVHVENCLPHLSRGTGIGHGHFHDCVTAVSLAIRNPGNEELSIGAIKLMQTISRRLAESDPQVSVLLANLVSGQDAAAVKAPVYSPAMAARTGMTTAFAAICCSKSPPVG